MVVDTLAATPRRLPELQPTRMELMHHWIGAGLMILGMAAVFLVVIINTNLPVQLGPLPFFGACALIIIGLLTWSF